jgi:hypothetical protein
VVIDFLGLPGNPIDKIHAFQEALEFKGAKNCLRAFGPIRNGFQAKIDLFGG